MTLLYHANKNNPTVIFWAILDFYQNQGNRFFVTKKNFRICKIDVVFGTITKSDCTAVERGITVNYHYNTLWCMLVMNGENLFENDIFKRVQHLKWSKSNFEDYFTHFRVYYSMSFFLAPIFLFLV